MKMKVFILAIFSVFLMSSCSMIDTQGSGKSSKGSVCEKCVEKLCASCKAKVCNKCVQNMSCSDCSGKKECKSCVKTSECTSGQCPLGKAKRGKKSCCG